MGPKLVPVNGHEHGAPRCGGIGAQHAVGTAAATLYLDELAVMQVEPGDVGRVHLHVWHGVELVQLIDQPRLRARVPVAGHPAGRELEGETLVGRFFWRGPTPCEETRPSGRSREAAVLIPPGRRPP